MKWKADIHVGHLPLVTLLTQMHIIWLWMTPKMWKSAFTGTLPLVGQAVLSPSRNARVIFTCTRYMMLQVVKLPTVEPIEMCGNKGNKFYIHLYLISKLANETVSLMFVFYFNVDGFVTIPLARVQIAAFLLLKKQYLVGVFHTHSKTSVWVFLYLVVQCMAIAYT